MNAETVGVVTKSTSLTIASVEIDLGQRAVSRPNSLRPRRFCHIFRGIGNCQALI